MTYSASAYPYDDVLYLDDFFGSQEKRQSAVIIGPHTILTAAHCLYSSESGLSATNITLYSGMTDGNNGTKLNIGQYTKHFMNAGEPDGRFSEADSQLDFGVIDCQADLSSYGSFGVTLNSPGGTVNVSGYPASAGQNQTTVSGTAYKNPIYNTIDYSSFGVSGGNSGGPIWTNSGTADNPVPNVIGIVSTGEWGVDLTTTDWQTITGWINGDAALWTPPSTPTVTPPQLFHDVHANDLAHSSTALGSNHFIDLQNFEASYPDLVQAFGTNQSAMASWYNTSETSEQRPETFDGLDYVASYTDLQQAFKNAGSLKAVQEAGADHYIENGLHEGRTTTFNGLDYIASYNDLINAFGADNDAGAYHFIEHGSSEGRSATFDGLDYIASYSDLTNAFGANEQAGAAHFIQHGRDEGRQTTFDGLAYIASNPDLIMAFGADPDAGASHYIKYGHNEDRVTTFDVASYEAAHPDLYSIAGQESKSQFLAQYIETFKATGHALT